MADITTDKITSVEMKKALDASDVQVAAYMDNVRKTNESLYMALQAAYRLTKTFIRVELHKAAKEIGVKVQTVSSGEVVAVKLVLRNADSSKASSYAAALLKADALNVAVEDFAEWVKEKGGIEAVRRGDLDALSKENKANRQAAIAKANDAMSGERAGAFMVAKPNKAQWKFPVHSDSKKAVWLVSERADGNFEVVAIHTAKGAVEAMVKRVGEALANPANVKDFKVILKPAVPNTAEQDAAKDRLAGKSE
ncbi:hypothetical protein M2360_004887 [Rhizobium sp. SG_E_25_P2]|uniref:hypothetical protein n=1 Tax=Rhizobium sp. SG_E_25_P2 TaxID=2879942 RepID=UPI002473CD1A|nr:hypothetical protein [Rhizobium sp. SG_E_25_P2]MDH6269459.1 hypothetical protein [Rhizobium sp. SG_E_25_P2]